MKRLSPERHELIEALVAETTLGGVTAALLEKDEHLTDALRALFALRLDGMALVFCGGTSLSKAHGLIERMSEDADLKIVLNEGAGPVSRSKVRSQLSALKGILAHTLAGIGLVEDQHKAKALNENHYLFSEWTYARRYDSVSSLRPHLQIELTARQPVSSPVSCQIGYLTDHLAGLRGGVFSVPTVVVAETVAEKVLSFLRRYAQHRSGVDGAHWDTALVRHIYDVHCVHSRHPGTVTAAAKVFPEIVAADQKAFGKQFPNFAVAALPVLSTAIRQARTDVKIETEYTRNLLPLVYGNDKPVFAEAFRSFELVASALLPTL
jgi:predicted nucleotidyltransferase component of viral defense system